jgi:hypothetical protein
MARNVVMGAGVAAQPAEADTQITANAGSHLFIVKKADRIPEVEPVQLHLSASQGESINTRGR